MTTIIQVKPTPRGNFMIEASPEVLKIIVKALKDQGLNVKVFNKETRMDIDIPD